MWSCRGVFVDYGNDATFLKSENEGVIDLGFLGVSLMVFCSVRSFLISYDLSI